MKDGVGPGQSPEVPRWWLVRTLVVTYLVLTAVVATRPMVSYKAVDAGASAAQIGFIAACYGLLSLFVAVPVGRYVDRWGAAPFIAMGAALVAAGSWWLVLADGLLSLAFSQTLFGLGWMFALVGLQAFIAEHSGGGRGRDRGYGMLTTANSVANVSGPLLVALLAGRLGYSAEFVFATAGVYALVAVAIGLSLWRATRHLRPAAGAAGQGRVGNALKEVMRIPSMPQAMLASMAVLTSMDIITVYMPAYGVERDLPVATVGLLLATCAGASIVSRAFMLAMLRVTGHRRLLVISLALPTAGLLALPFVDSVAVMYCLLFVAGFGLGLAQPVTLVYVASKAPTHLRGLALGARLSANRAGQLAVPTLAGVVAGSTVIGGVFLTLAALLGGSGVWIARSDFTVD